MSSSADAVLATDCSPAAVQCARRNLERFGVRAEVRLSDMFAHVPETFDHIVFNPPVHHRETERDRRVKNRLKRMTGSPRHSDTSGPTSTITIRRLTAADSTHWDTYVRQSPDSTIYHLLGLKAAIEETYHATAIYLLALDDSNTTVGVLPLVSLPFPWLTDALVSLPYSAYGGALADSEEVRQALLRKAESIRVEMGLGSLLMKNLSHTAFDAFSDERVHYSMMLDTNRSFTTIWRKSMTASCRNHCNKAARLGVRIEIGHDDAVLRDFYRLYVDQQHRHGSPMLVETAAFADGIPDRYASDDVYVCFRLLDPRAANPLERLELVPDARCSYTSGGPFVATMMLGSQVECDRSRGWRLVVHAVAFEADRERFECARRLTDGQCGDHRRIDPAAEQDTEFEIRREQPASHGTADHRAEPMHRCRLAPRV